MRCRRRPDLQLWSESAWIEVQLSGCRSLIVGCVYRPPSSSIADINDFARCLELALDNVDHRRFQTVLVGDFNATSPSWCPSDTYNVAGLALEPVFHQLGLSQCVDFPTHLGNDGRLRSLLDLVHVSDRALLWGTSALPPLKSDHIMLESTLALRVSVNPSALSRRIWLYDNADFEKINKLLSNLDWSAVSTAPDINQAWAAWKNIFMSVIDREVPSHLANPSSRAGHPWIDARLKSS